MVAMAAWGAFTGALAGNAVRISQDRKDGWNQQLRSIQVVHCGLNEIARLGTNLLTVTNGQTFSGATAMLPTAAPGMIARLPGVAAVQDTGTVTGVNAYKSPLIPPINTNAISVDATTLGLPAVAGTSSRRAGS